MKIKKRRFWMDWLGLVLIIGICIYWLPRNLFEPKSPSLPESPETVIISLKEPESPFLPNSGELIVEEFLSEPAVIAKIARAFSQARASNDHKCPSLGRISFTSDSKTATLDVLPGHDPKFYEFRHEGRMFRLPREQYISALVAAGIERSDIRLDGHPSIEQAEALKP